MPKIGTDPRRRPRGRDCFRDLHFDTRRNGRDVGPPMNHYAIIRMHHNGLRAEQSTGLKVLHRPDARLQSSNRGCTDPLSRRLPVPYHPR